MTNILIVDDDPTIRAMFARALQSLGSVEQASNGADALRLLGAQKYSVILLDLHMPVIDGFVILHTLSTKAGPNRETPIYVVTADASDQSRIRALRRHAVFFLTKPVPIATLVALVDSTLKKSAARAQMPAKAAAGGGLPGGALGRPGSSPGHEGSALNRPLRQSSTSLQVPGGAFGKPSSPSLPKPGASPPPQLPGTPKKAGS